jgi:hypothetical protein
VAIELSIEAHEGYLLARVAGAFVLDKAQAVSLLFLQACVAQQQAKVLVDVRQIQGPISVIERFRYSEFMARQVAALGRQAGGPIRLAYLGHEPVLDAERFGVMVAYNRGVRALATESLEEALGWLEK